MTEIQLEIVVAFVSELIRMGGVDLIPKGVLLLKSCPFFWYPNQSSLTSGGALLT
jgi:hypothetical protein